MKKTLLIWICTLLVAFGLGWLAGGFHSSPKLVSQVHQQKNIARSRLADDAGRAIADVTPGQEVENAGPVYSLLELFKMGMSQKFHLETDRFAESLNQNGVLEALKRLRSLPRGEMRNELTYDLVSHLAHLNPQAAVRQLASPEIAAVQRGSLYDSVASVWAEKDMRAAEKWVQSLPEGELKRRAESGLLDTKIETDPIAALDMVMASQSLSGANNRGYANRIFTALTQRDPADAAIRALALPGNDFSKSAIETVVTNWSAQDPTAAAAWALQLPDFMQKETLLNVFNVWGLNDGPTAANYLNKLPTDALRSAMQTALGRSWASYDATGALHWAEKLPLDPQREDVFSGIFWEWTQNDPKGVAEYIVRQPEADGMRHHLRDLAGSWGRNQPTEALAWAKAQTDPALASPLEVGFVAPLLGYWAESNPAAAAANVLLLKDENARRSAVVSISSAWAKADPQKALTWLETTAVDDENNNGMRNLFMAWTRNSPEDATESLNQFPLGPKRDVAIDALSETLAAKDPRTAVTWANAVTDDSRRTSSVRYVLKVWSKSNPQAARAWLSEQPITPEQAHSLGDAIGEQ